MINLELLPMSYILVPTMIPLNYADLGVPTAFPGGYECLYRQPYLYGGNGGVFYMDPLQVDLNGYFIPPLSAYCWWGTQTTMNDEEKSGDCSQPSFAVDSSRLAFTTSTNEVVVDQIDPLSIEEQRLRPKKKLLLQQRIENKRPKILKALDLIMNDNAPLIVARQKAAPRRSANSNRRSTFIGVFKNGPNWQALISIDKRKTYIGTYATELEAARAFDYHSILLHDLTAITNFNYSKSEILQLFAEQEREAS